MNYLIISYIFLFCQVFFYNYLYISLLYDIIRVMKDTELNKILGISVQTLQDWKKRDPDNYRRLIYELLSSYSKEELEKRVEAIKLLKGIK
jgi:uncharacterized protein YjcR